MKGACVYKAKIISTGYYLPSKVVTNKDLESVVDTSDEWITTMTGIKERRIAAAEESASDMGIKAGRSALRHAGMNPEDVDAIICATITPDYLFPSTASVIQKELGLVNAFAYDLSAACSGFIYALSSAENFLLQDKAKTVLVVASEKMSYITDWKDRSTCVLFGDGAGAVVMQKVEGERGVLSSYLGSDGSLGHLLMVPAGGSRKPLSEEVLKNGDHYLKMEGNKVFKVAVQKMVESARRALERAAIDVDDINWVIPHQANLRIIDAIEKRLKIPKKRMLVNLYKTGNTSAASIALALSEAEEKDMFKKNDIIVLVSFGAGFTWAGMTLRW